MTEDEGNALSAFLQALAVSLSNFLDQVPPEDRTMENFRHGFDGYLEAILSDPSASTPNVQESAQLLQQLLYREIDRMPLHRIQDDSIQH